MNQEEQEIAEIENEIARLNRAIRNPCLSCAQAGSSGHRIALERITQKQTRATALRRLAAMKEDKSE